MLVSLEKAEMTRITMVSVGRTPSYLGGDNGGFLVVLVVEGLVNI